MVQFRLKGKVNRKYELFSDKNMVYCI